MAVTYDLYDENLDEIIFFISPKLLIHVIKKSATYVIFSFHIGIDLKSLKALDNLK